MLLWIAKPANRSSIQALPSLQKEQDAIDTVVEQIIDLSFAKHGQFGYGDFQFIHFERDVISVEVTAMINILCVRINNRIVAGGIYFVNQYFFRILQLIIDGTESCWTNIRKE